jgi:hypothetical protein
VELSGESFDGDSALPHALAVDIRNRFLPLLKDLAEMGGAYGESGEIVADFTKSPPLGNETLVAVDGCEIDVVIFSNGNFEKLTAGLIGLLKTGVSAFRNSV